jgi:hypothetical protein
VLAPTLLIGVSTVALPGCQSGIHQTVASSEIAPKAHGDWMTVRQLRANAEAFKGKRVSLVAVVVETSPDNATNNTFLVLADDSDEYWTSLQRSSAAYRDATDCVLLSPRMPDIGLSDRIEVKGTYDFASNELVNCSVDDLTDSGSQSNVQTGETGIRGPATGQ